MKVRITFSVDDEFRRVLGSYIDGVKSNRLATREDVMSYLYTHGVGGHEDLYFYYGSRYGEQDHEA